MTSTQAAELREQRRQRVDRLPCDHLDQELENIGGLYLTGHCFCKACGELIVHPS
jgi:hypothetical protein